MSGTKWKIGNYTIRKIAYSTGDTEKYSIQSSAQNWDTMEEKIAEAGGKLLMTGNKLLLS